ncbi:hypothetical protein ACQRBP_12515 [Eubacteriales bacterium SGI.150]
MGLESLGVPDFWLYSVRITLVDDLGNPLAFMLSFGNDHDSVHAVSLLSQFNIERNNILGDKACGAKAIREFHAYYSRAENINAFN